MESFFQAEGAVAAAAVAEIILVYREIILHGIEIKSNRYKVMGYDVIYKL